MVENDPVPGRAMERVGRVLRFLSKAGGVVVLLAAAATFLMFSFWIYSTGKNRDDPFWGEILWLVFELLQTGIALWCVMSAWELMTKPADVVSPPLPDQPPPKSRRGQRAAD